MNNKPSSTNKLLILCMLVCLVFTLQTNIIDSGNYIAIKNSKIYAFKFFNTSYNQEQYINTQNRIFITNTQQSIKIQVPIISSTSKSSHQIANYSQPFPAFYNKLNTKGYIRPLNQYSSKDTQIMYLKGYKYLKSNQNYQKSDQIIVEIQLFLQNILKQNQFNFLNIRMEDTFQIQVDLKQSTWLLVSIQVKYLFATVEKDNIPSNILNALNTYKLNYQQYQEAQKVGTIQRKLSGRGFHQWVNLTIQLQDKTDIQLQSQRNNCFIQFTDILPESTYIDVDQRRQQTTNFQTINIELPSFASKQYFYSYKVSLSQFQQCGVRKYLYQQPIHFRYPQASELNITNVYLHPIENSRIVCDQNGEQKTYSLKQNHLVDRGTAKIPNGDSSISKVVSIASLVICLIAVLKIAGSLKKA